MTRAHRISTRVLAAVTRLPIYAALIAALVLVLATANDAPHTTTATPKPG